MPDWLPEAWALTLFGLAGGIALGLAARLGGFCTLGAIENALFAGRFRELAMWLWALGLAIAAIGIAKAWALIDVQQSLFAVAPVSLLACILGGLMFGYGMALAGNCGFTALARFGSGDLRAFVILLVIGIAAYASIGGPLAGLRIAMTGTTPAPLWLDETLGAWLRLPAILVALAIGLALAATALAFPAFRRDRTAWLWATVVALAIVSGWLATAWSVQTGFALAISQSHSFSAPIGQSLLYVMTSTGSSPGFGVGSVTGVVLGSAMGSLWRHGFAFEACDDPRELGRQIFGACLMGTGAVWALGCSIGEGLSGVAVLAWSGPVVLASIATGAIIGIKQLVHGLSWTHP